MIALGLPCKPLRGAPTSCLNEAKHIGLEVAPADLSVDSIKVWTLSGPAGGGLQYLLSGVK
jgi:hypothetical protein